MLIQNSLEVFRQHKCGPRGVDHETIGRGIIIRSAPRFVEESVRITASRLGHGDLDFVTRLNLEYDLDLAPSQRDRVERPGEVVVIVTPFRTEQDRTKPNPSPHAQGDT